MMETRDAPYTGYMSEKAKNVGTQSRRIAYSAAPSPFSVWIVDGTAARSQIGPLSSRLTLGSTLPRDSKKEYQRPNTSTVPKSRTTAVEMATSVGLPSTPRDT